MPRRSTNADHLRAILSAIQNKKALHIRYQSMSRPNPTWRWITPHALGFDGFRWHARSLCHLDRTYKDFKGLDIFFHDPVLPDNGHDGRNWRDDFQLTLHVQDEVRVVRKTGNIFLTNIHRVYAGDEAIASAEERA